MKYLQIISILSLITITGCSTTKNINDRINIANLYGSWNCKFSIQEDEITSTIDYEITYVRNGTSNTFGTLNFNTIELGNIEYSWADSSHWEYKNGYLIETSSEIKLVNTSHPGLDEIFKLEDFFPQKLSESSKILVLDNSLLKVKSESDGETYTCNRVVKTIN